MQLKPKNIWDNLGYPGSPVHKARGILPLSGSSWLIILDLSGVLWVYRNWHEPDYLFGMWRRVRKSAPDYHRLHNFVDAI